jgi:hypothetical protein
MIRTDIETTAETQAQRFVVTETDIVAIWLLCVSAGVAETLAALLGWRTISRSRSRGERRPLMAEYPYCGEETWLVVDPLLPDPDHSAYACEHPDWGMIVGGKS